MRKLFVLFLSISVLFIVLTGFIISTETGLLLLKKSINKICDPFFTIGEAKGRLVDNWSLHNVKVEMETVSVEIAEIEWSWRPAKLLSGELDIARVMVRKSRVALKSSKQDVSPDSSLTMPEIFLPFVFVARDFGIENLTIVDSDGSELLQVESGGGSIEWRDSLISLKSFFLNAPEFGIKSHGSLDVGNDSRVDVLGNYRFSMGGVNNLAGTYSIKGLLNNLQVDLGLQYPAAVRAKGRVFNLLEDPHWQVTVNGRDVDLGSFHSVMPDILLSTAEVHASGDLDGYSGNVLAEGRWDELTDVHLTSNLTADWYGIDFQSLHLSSGEQTAVAEKSSISWADTFSWSGHFIFENFNPAVITEEIPGKIDAELNSRGKVVGDGVEAFFGITRLEGKLHQQQIGARGDVFLTEHEVYSDGLSIQSGDYSGNVLLHHGSFSWAEPLRWVADLSFDNFDPSPLYPELYGQVSGRIKGEINQAEEGVDGFVKLEKLSGMLRGQKISGKGGIQLKDGKLQTDGITVRHGLSKIRIDGIAGDSFALRFSIFSPEIGQLIPGGKGSLSINGELAGSSEHPELTVDLHGKKLIYREFALSRVDAGFDGELSSRGKFQGTLRGKDIKGFGVAFDSIDFEAAGTPGKHSAMLQISSRYGDSKLRVRGGYRKDLWQEDLYDITHTAVDQGKVKQEDVAHLTAGMNGLKLENFCLKDGEGQFCLGGKLDRRDDGFSWQVRSSLSNVILPWLNRTGLISIPVNGAISGELEAAGDGKGILRGNLQLELPEADFEIQQAEEELRHLTLDNTVITSTLTNGRLLSALSTTMAGGGLLRLSAEISDFGPFAYNPQDLLLDGDIFIRTFDLRFLEPFTGFWVEPIGKMDGSLSLSGSLGQPEASGELRLIHGGLALPYQGVTFENVKLTLSAEEKGARVRCEASSGGGDITVSGKLQYGGGDVKGNLEIRGNNFLLFNLPEYEVRVTPDAKFLFSSEKGDFSGSVKIPYAKITPEEMTSSVSVSNDVIFVNGGQELKEKKWPVFTKLKVYLGDDVRVDGYGLKGRLGGAIEVVDRPDSYLSGTGELKLVDGTFTVFGRAFDIERGRMLFTGGPIDNPGIDARAQQIVSAEAAVGDGYVVGIDVSGLVQNLQFHLFSDPYMSDTDILSHLLVGRTVSDSSENESNILEAAAVAVGVQKSSKAGKSLGNFLAVDDLHLEGSGEKENMSLVVGKRITKNLYLGYDMNVFSQLGVFRVRYGLAHGFSIETQTSTEATGTDLLYSFER
jgi:translocation and assembly module TamB